MVDYLKDALGIDAQQVATAKGIDTYTKEFNQFNSDPSGQQALANLLGNMEAPKEQRAAAAQALNPGMKATIGEHGELSFTAGPDSSIGYKMPDPMYKERQTMQAKVAGGQAPDILANFDSTFKSIQGSKDIIEAENIYASLNASAADYISAKELSIKNRLSTTLGIPQLEAQLAADRQLDEQYYASTGRPYQGPTSETLANLQMYNNETSRLDQMVAKELTGDSEIAALKSRLQGVESIMNSKRGSANKALAGEAVSEDISALVPVETVDSVMTTMGLDPKNSTARNNVIEQIATGRGPAVEVNKINSMSTLDMIGTATTDTPEAKYAVTALSKKFGNPEQAKKLIEITKNFDTAIMPSLSEDQRAALAPPAANYGMGVEAKKQAALDIQRMKANIVLERFQATRAAEFAKGLEAVATPGSSGWAMPTAESLLEVPKIVQTLKEQDPNRTVDISVLASRMDFSGDSKKKVQDLAEWAYSQALLEGNNAAMGMPAGYHSVDSIKQMIQTQIAYEASKKYLGSDHTKPVRMNWSN